MAILLAAQPIAAQVSARLAHDGAEPPAATVAPVEIPADLQLAFELIQQPGFHPELFELFSANDKSENLLGTSAPALQTTHWVGIGFAIGLVVAVLIWYVHYQRQFG
jgi:hypothetical protein